MFGRVVPSASIAQLVEQAPLKREVVGSIPSGRTVSQGASHVEATQTGESLTSLSPS